MFLNFVIYFNHVKYYIYFWIKYYYILSFFIKSLICMYKGVKMNKKIFILVFLFIALISMSAVSAADLDDSNETVALSETGGGKLPFPMMLMQ